MLPRILSWLSSHQISIRDGVGASITIFMTAAIGIITTANQSHKSMDAQLGDLLTTSAKALSVLVEAESFQALSEAEMESTKTYYNIYKSIHSFSKMNPIFKYAYTCRLVGDSVFFVVDGTAPGDADGDQVEDHSALMEHYPDATPNMLTVLKLGGADYDKEPFTDSWGTFQSGCAGIKNAKQEVVGAACVDMDISSFTARINLIRKSAYLGLGLSFFISCGIGFAVFLLRRKQVQTQTQLILLSQDQEQKNLALQESQSRLVESQKQAGLGHWTFYSATGEMEWSEEMYHIHQIPNASGPPSLAESIESLLPEDQEVYRRSMRLLLENGESREWSYRKKNNSTGNQLHLFSKAKPEKDSQGKVWIIRGITQDMTEWHAIETKLIAAKDRAESAAKAKSEFLAMMSHEIRTPMNGVLGMAHILKDSNLNADQVSLLNTLLDSGEHLLTLINDILDFSKIEAGRMEIELIPFDLKRLSNSVCDILREKATWAESQLSLSYNLEEEVQFLGDPGRIRQILFNLIGNAVKFTKSGQIKLQVENAADHPGFLSLSVEDTGIGMSPVQLENLFQPFTQADTSTARKYGGTGLGLAITLKLVDLMRGTVQVESELAKGSRFRVLLPLARVESNAPGNVQGNNGEIIPDQAGLRILLVDDRDSSRMVIRRQLENLNTRVFEAESAPQARSILAELIHQGNPPQIGIIDWRMDVEDGIDLCKSLRSMPEAADMPLILISYAAARGDAQKAREAGFDGFLVKPVPVEILSGAIYLACKRSEPGEHPLITQHLIRELRLVLPQAGIPTPLLQNHIAIPSTPFDWSKIKPRILLAEDNLVNQKVAVRMLEKMGCQVSLAENGIEALNMGIKETFHLILMDCMMPEMDGYEATSAIREREKPTGRHTPIVACTANASQEEIQKAIGSGMDDFLSKPYKPQGLKDIIEKWVSQELNQKT